MLTFKELNGNVKQQYFVREERRTCGTTNYTVLNRIRSAWRLFTKDARCGCVLCTKWINETSSLFNLV